jgi:hypothetical protein
VRVLLEVLTEKVSEGVVFLQQDEIRGIGSSFVFILADAATARRNQKGEAYQQTASP